MMAYRSYPLLAAVGVLAWAAARCPAQAPPVPPAPAPAPLQRPTVSPYLNLLRQGGSPALNYYNLVRPQTQLYSSVQGLQQQVGVNRQDITGVQQTLGQPVLPPTGHPVGFLNHRQYFQTGFGGAAAGGTGSAAAPTLSRPTGGAAAAPTGRTSR